MLENISRKVRRVIPRWRNIGDSINFKSVQGRKCDSPLVTQNDWNNAFNKWRARKDPNSALELVTMYSAFGQYCPLSKSEINNEIAIGEEFDTAIRILNFDSNNHVNLSNETSDVITSSNIARKLKQARNATRLQPRDALAWLELARFYTLLGLHETQECDRAITVASQLAPDNRYIARAAVRYFVHRKLPDRAINVLLSSQRTLNDPWMASALIAAREIAGASHSSIKNFTHLANDQNWPIYSRSELLAGIATLEANNGADRTAKNLFNNAIQDPTENTLAQIQWFSYNHKKIIIPETTLVERYAFEAIETQAFKDADWSRVVSSSLSWQNIEPFSKRPALNGSMVALSVLGDTKSALDLMSTAYLSNPDDLLVANNYAVSLICSGELVKAGTVIRNAIKSDSKLEISALLATSGMLSFRLGDITSGREMYEKARKVFQNLKDKRSEFSCCLYWAREELLANNNQRAIELAEQAKKTFKDFKKNKLAVAEFEYLISNAEH